MQAGINRVATEATSPVVSTARVNRSDTQWLLAKKPQPLQPRKRAAAVPATEIVLSPEQATIENVLVHGTTANYVVIGPPGQGKTVLMRSTIAKLIAASRVVCVVAPTNVALSQYHKGKMAKHSSLMLMTSAGFVGRQIMPPSTPLKPRIVDKRKADITQALTQAKSSSLVVILDEVFATPCEDVDNILRILQVLPIHVTIVAVGDPQQLGPVKAKNPLLSHLFFRFDRRRSLDEVLVLAKKRLKVLSLTGKNHRFHGGDAEHTAMLAQAERQIRAGAVDAAAHTLNMIALSIRTVPPPGTKYCTYITATRMHRRSLQLRALKTMEDNGRTVYHHVDPKDERNDTFLVEGSRHRMTRAVFQAVPDHGKGEARRINNGTIGVVQRWNAVADAGDRFAVFRPDNQRTAYRVPLDAVTSAAVMTIAASQGDTFDGMAVLDCTGIRTVYRETSELLQALCVAITRSKKLRVINYTPDLLKQPTNPPNWEGDSAVVHGIHETMRRLIKGRTIQMISAKMKVPELSQAVAQQMLRNKHKDNPTAVQIVEWTGGGSSARARLICGVQVEFVR